MPSIVVAALYKFTHLTDYTELRQKILNLGKEENITGTILLAEEGVNGTVAGTRQAINKLKCFLDQDSRFDGMEYKESFAEIMPFYRFKVRLKKEIVTLGQPEANPADQVGTYVDPQDWNELIKDSEVVVVDTRNTYEVALGSFKNALNPKTNSFREFPDFVEKNLMGYKDKKIALSCTGGIRCEKATSYLLSRGFKQVYHLKGGILKYLEEIPSSESLWEGECFVFDERVAVGNEVKVVGTYFLCRGCRMPLSKEDKKSPYYEEGVSCSYCYEKTSAGKKEGFRQRHRQLKEGKKKDASQIEVSFNK